MLIAVTVLTFVLVVGFFTFQNTCATQFEQKVRASVVNFANTIESVYSSPVGASLPLQMDFSPGGSSCVGGISDIRVLKLTEEECKQSIGFERACYGVAAITTTFHAGTAGQAAKERTLSFVQPIRVPADTSISYEQIGVCFVSFKDGTGLDAAGNPDPTQQDFSVDNLRNLDDIGDTGASKCYGWKLRLYNLQVTRKDASTVQIKEGG